MIRIFLDANIVYGGHLLSDLPKSLKSLASKLDEDHVITLPKTTILEFKQKQTKDKEKKVNSLVTSLTTLQAEFDHIGITREDIHLQIKAIDLEQLFYRANVRYEVVEPTFEDFQKAHERACLKLSPLNSDSKSNEMRDMTILELALRLAKREGKAYLISNDGIFENSIETQQNNLTTFKSIQELEEFLFKASPQREQAIELLSPYWSELRNYGIPLKPEITLSLVQNAKFTKTRFGVRASFEIETLSEQGEIVKANISIEPISKEQSRIWLSQLLVGEEQREGIALIINREILEQSYEKDLEQLKKLLED